MAKKPTKRTTAKKVQGLENRPFKLPQIEARPDIDEDAWGADGLTLKQRLFVQFYLGEAAGNGTKAARLAGYRDDNEHGLAATASENLRKPNIARALEREIGKRFGSVDDVRNSLAAIASGNAADYLATDPATGKLVPDLDKLAASGGLGLLHQIQEEVTEVDGVRISTTKRKFKLYDRLRALELLAKINGQLIDRVRHEGEVKFNPITLDGDKDIGDTRTEVAAALSEAAPGNSVPSPLHDHRSDDEGGKDGGLPHLDIGESME